MPSIPPDVLLDQLSWRYAVKKFDPAKKIPARDWGALERSLTLTPSSYGLQPWQFLVVTDRDVRTSLLAASWNQPQVVDASHLVVFARRTSMGRADVDKLIRRICEVRGVPEGTLDGYRGMMLGSIESPAPGTDHSTWNAKQVYIALGFFLAAAALLGIDACPMEGFDASRYDQILGLSGSGYSATVVATAGYRDPSDSAASFKKVRFTDAELIRRV